MGKVLAKKIVTVCTDASYNHKSKAGSYAFYVKSNGVFIKKFGMLRDKVSSPTHAEFKCIVNAIYVTLENVSGPVYLIVNTDCLNAVSIMNNDVASIEKYRLHDLKDYRTAIMKMVKKYEKQNGSISVDFRHVKAHTGSSENRSKANEWCDFNAKAMMGLYLNNL